MDILTDFFKEPQKELEVINFTNIDKEDFIGQFGRKEAQVGIDKDGKPRYKVFPVDKTIKTGTTQPFPRMLAEHYALHLAQKIAIREGKDFNDEGVIKPLFDKILGEVKVEVEEVKEEVSQSEEVFEGLKVKAKR